MCFSSVLKYQFSDKKSSDIVNICKETNHSSRINVFTFRKPEKLADGRRVRVTVDVFGKGLYSGIGRNYRIAKCTAAKCALRQLKKLGLIKRNRAD